MKVKELIEQLSAFDPELDVITTVGVPGCATHYILPDDQIVLKKARMRFAGGHTRVVLCVGSGVPSGYRFKEEP